MFIALFGYFFCSSGAESVLFYAIITLHNLLLFNEKPKQEVRRHGQVVIPILLGLLQKDNPKFLAIVSDCLQILAYLHQETKVTVEMRLLLLLLLNLIYCYSSK